MRATKLSEDGSEWYDLLCPRCSCDKVAAESTDLSKLARCCECGHEFVITEKCWVLTRLFNDGWDEHWNRGRDGGN